MGLLRTCTIKEGVELIIYAFEQEQEDRLWELWISGNTGEKTFEAFRNKQVRTARHRGGEFDDKKTGAAFALVKPRRKT